MRALLDTCVILDVLQKREPFFSDSHLIFLEAANCRFAGSITANSVTDIYYLMHKYLHDDATSRQAIAALFKLFSVLDTTELDCRKALLSSVAEFEDALMIETAIRSDCDCIVTRNIRDYAPSRLPVYAPERFLTILRSGAE